MILTTTIWVDCDMRLYYKRGVSLDEGPCSRGDPEDGAGSGVLRPRLVTAGSGGPGNRRSGTTTRLRTGRSSFGANAGGMSLRLSEQKAPGWSAGRAPPPSSGGHAPSCHRRKGGPCQSARAPPPRRPAPARRSMSLAREGEGRRERATPGARKCKWPGGAALARARSAKVGTGFASERALLVE